MAKGKENGCTWKCQNPECGLEGRASWSTWAVQITGAMEILCPTCGHISVFVASFGQNVRFHRASKEVQQAMQNRPPVEDMGEGRTKPAGDGELTVP